MLPLFMKKRVDIAMLGLLGCWSPQELGSFQNHLFSEGLKRPISAPWNQALTGPDFAGFLEGSVGEKKAGQQRPQKASSSMTLLLNSAVMRR